MQQYGLTLKQLECYNFIKNYIAKKIISPSYNEIKEAVGLQSKSSVNAYIKNLEERGYVKRIPGKARSLVLIK